MKLYYAPGTCALAPHIVLSELGLPHAAIKVDLKTGTTENGSDYRQINTKGYVPALDLGDGTHLTEAAVLIQYLADQAPRRRAGAGQRHDGALPAAGVGEFHRHRNS